MNRAAARMPLHIAVPAARSHSMHRSQHGFALVEAVLAVVLLAIVAVTIVGQFGGNSNETTAMVHGVDAKTSSAAAINYAARVLDPVVLVVVEESDDCAVREPAADFPPALYDPGFFSAGSGTTCR
jgi:type II secretory pathway pseudopilin PulG